MTCVFVPCILAQSVCWAWWACLPASMSRGCGYFWMWVSKAALSACVGRGLGVLFCGVGLAWVIWKRFLRPLIVPRKGLVGVRVKCWACQGGFCVWPPNMKVDIWCQATSKTLFGFQGGPGLVQLEVSSSKSKSAFESSCSMVACFCIPGAFADAQFGATDAAFEVPVADLDLEDFFFWVSTVTTFFVVVPDFCHASCGSPLLNDKCYSVSE